MESGDVEFRGSERERGPGKEIYFAGMYDFEPVDPKTGKKYPNVWQKEAQRYVKGETGKLGGRMKPWRRGEGSETR